MKRTTTLLILISIFSFLGFSQSNAQNKMNNPPPTNQIGEEYVIGIGNKEFKLYENVLIDFQNNPDILVYAVCNGHQVIGLKVINNYFKSYDFLRDYLENQYPNIQLYRKDDSIFSLDCKNEILKP